jgi:hypothetical protein
MNVKIWSYSFSHLVEECFLAIILGQENGKTLHCHMSGKMECNTLGLGRRVDQNDQKNSKKMLTLLEILSYATTMFATGMQLPVACNYARFFMQLQWIFAPFLGVYATMVQL